MTDEGGQRLGDFFWNRREKGKPGLPTLSVTLNDGLVDRTSLDRKTDTMLSEEEHLLARKGDIVYNTMRMWQGASGLAEKDGLVSPAYVVLAPKPGIDPRYASYLFKTQRMIHRFWAYSYGLTADRLRLYHADFSKIPVSVPSIDIQARAVEVLSVWDAAIDRTEALIANTKVLGRSILEKVLGSGKDRIGDNWELVHVGDLATLNPPAPIRPASENVAFVPMSAVSDDGQLIRIHETSYSSVSKGHPAFLEQDVLVAKITPCFENGKGALAKGLQGKVGFASTEFHVVRPNKEWAATFLHHVLSSRQFRARGELRMQGSAGQRRVPADYIRKFAFRVPREIGERVRVAEALNRRGDLLSVFQGSLRSLIRQRHALEQQLLSGKFRTMLEQPD